MDTYQDFTFFDPLRYYSEEEVREKYRCHLKASPNGAAEAWNMKNHSAINFLLGYRTVTRKGCPTGHTAATLPRSAGVRLGLSREWSPVDSGWVYKAHSDGVVRWPDRPKLPSAEKLELELRGSVLFMQHCIAQHPGYSSLQTWLEDKQVVRVAPVENSFNL